MSKAVQVTTWFAIVFLLSLTQPASAQVFPDTSLGNITDRFDLSNQLHWNYRPPGPSLSLARWMVYQVERTEQARRTPRNFPKYNRDWHFGGWVNEDGPRDCFDTRHEVLIRANNPKTPVVFKADDRCHVMRGGWLDPYSGKAVRMAGLMDIDHVVAIGHAYDNGAYKWKPALRCHYANFLNNGFHLLAVTAHENRSKSAKDPTGYVPPNRQFVCTYLSFWLKIKLVWDLEISRAEAETIASVFRQANCDLRAQVMGQADFKAQQAAASIPSAACERKMAGRGNTPPRELQTFR